MAIWVREGSLGTGSGSSFANAKSFYDIETWAPAVVPGTEILFHHLDDFHVPGHGNSPYFRVTLNGAKTAQSSFAALFQTVLQRPGAHAGTG